MMVGPSAPRLFLFLDVDGVLTKPRAVLLQFELLASGLSLKCVVVVTRFLADKKNGFRFFL